MYERQAAVAGTFYSENPHELEKDVLQLLAAADKNKLNSKAMIVPHAGFIYSGPIAANAYASLEPRRHTITRIVLLGPSHRVHLKGLAISSAKSFITPLGSINLDRDSIDLISSLPQVHEQDDAHLMEHSLEVQLPFLQLTLDYFELVPIVVGDASASDVADVLELLWGEEETLIIISSDLSHFHDYKTAQRLDSQTNKAIESLSYENLTYEDACGRNPVRGLLEIARRKNMHVENIGLKNSGDTAGSKDQVVGYGAYIFY